MTAFTSGEDFSQVSLFSLRALLEESMRRRPARERLGAMLDRLVEAMAYHRVSLELLDVPLPSLRLSLSRGSKALFASPDGPDPTVIGQVLTTRRPVIIENVAEHPDFYGRHLPEHEHLSLICVPIICGQHADERAPLGTLCADVPKAPPVFLERHRDFLLTAAAVFAATASRLVTEKTPQSRMEYAPAPPSEDQSKDHAAQRQRVVAVSKNMRLAQRQIEQAAQSSSPILLRGEEGTGKQYLARALHALGKPGRPFQRLACAAEPPETAYQTLFGVEKDQKAGVARSKRGVLELAQGGDLSLEDVDALPIEAQRALLRFLQEGSDTRLTLNVRIIAASSANLEDLVKSGTFLENLYRALSAATISVPPLRDRVGDILPLAEHFLAEYAKTKRLPFKRISTPAIDLINQYHWPDNVLELRSSMERAFDQSEDGVIRAYHLPPSLQTAESSHTEATLSFGEAVDQFEKELLTEALKKNKGNMFQAAKELRESYRVVNYKVKKHAIDPKRFTLHKK